MEIYYCHLCGTKVDSDALARGDALRRGTDQFFCRDCMAKAPPPTATPSGNMPAVKPVSRDHRPIRTPLRPNERPAAKAAAPVSPKAFAVVVVGLAAAILAAAAVTFIKGKPEAEKPPETPAVTKPPESSKRAPAIEQPTAAETEKSADAAFSAIMKAAGAKSPKETADALGNFLEHYPTAAAVPRARVELSRLKKVQKVLADGFVTLGTFEASEDNWGFHDGGEFPGAKGSIARDTNAPKEGAQSMKLSGDFSGGGSYVCVGHNLGGATTDVLMGIPYSRVAGIRLWVRSPVAGSISLRANDNADQCHQQDLSYSPKKEWQQIEFKSLTKGHRYSHWGGKNDGVFYWPLRAVTFMLTIEGVGPKKIAEVDIDQVELILIPDKK